MKRLAGLLLLLSALMLWSGAASSAAAPAPSVAFGAYLPKVERDPNRIDRYARLVGRSPVLVSYYMPWDYVPFDPAQLDGIWQRGAVPIITWEPLSYTGAEYPLRQIQRGRFDPYIRDSANAARRWGRPILVRFAHEMNGSWYPWGRGVEGNNSYRIRAVWRRIVDIFRKRGADNVQWVWTPNVNTGGELPFRDLFPGDAWVDWVGFDGFNWAPPGEWNSFTEIVDNTYEEIAKLTDRPMIVAETGSNEEGGDKAAWVTSALREEIPKLPRIRAVVWFNDVFDDVGSGGGGTLDARATSSRESLRAFRSGIASSRYDLSRAAFLSTPATYTPDSGSAPSPPSDGFGKPGLVNRLIDKLHGKYVAFAAVAGLAALLCAFVAVILVRRRRRSSARSKSKTVR
jgi:hypothetical protein